MTLNLVVPIGEIRFVLVDGRPLSETAGNVWEISLSRKTYKRLTIPPGIWVAFKGINEKENMLLNIANIPHEPEEAENADLDDRRFASVLGEQ